MRVTVVKAFDEDDLVEGEEKGEKEDVGEKRKEEETEFEMDKDLLRLKEEKYRIKSKVIDDKRWFLCPFQTCEKKFCSQRMADACINYHLGLLYKCITCEFVTHNYDSSRNHKCFAYAGGRKEKV